VKDIILLVLLTSGEVQETHYPDNIDAEWVCVQEAVKAEKNGNQAYCIIPAPDEVGLLDEYPD
jgi:hypothetical protein